MRFFILFVMLGFATVGCDNKRKIALEERRLELEEEKLRAQQIADMEERMAEERRRKEEERKKQEYEKNKSYVHYIIDKYKGWVIERYQGGKNVRATVDDWEYDKYRDVYTIEITVNWNGKHNEFNEYYVEGIFTVGKEDENGSRDLRSIQQIKAPLWKNMKSTEPLEEFSLR